MEMTILISIHGCRNWRLCKWESSSSFRVWCFHYTQWAFSSEQFKGTAHISRAGHTQAAACPGTKPYSRSHIVPWLTSVTHWALSLALKVQDSTQWWKQLRLCPSRVNNRHLRCWLPAPSNTPATHTPFQSMPSTGAGWWAQHYPPLWLRRLECVDEWWWHSATAPAPVTPLGPPQGGLTQPDHLSPPDVPLAHRASHTNNKNAHTTTN